MGQYEREIESTLRDVLSYVDADPKYAQYAQLISYMEWLLKKCGVRDV